ncbi:MAG: serine/threonine protein kinase, partial [Acidobacteria bacterium]|nr:serine/threonine protein kinase [Acidobacteriota bacterium]
MNEKDLRTKKRVINTFEVIFDASTGDREDLFASLCGEDLSLRREVETMLKAAVSLDDFMETPAAETAFEVYENYLSDNLLGRKIGNYRLVSAIGQGGMGTVFLGKRDDEIDQLVAIKIISPFATNESDAENFKRERQILARLEHANISRLIDAGTTADGTPFLVMEYVKGVSLTNYCSTKALSLSARLELFLEVCEAVRFAHQNLVIHRDLKPTNILVTEDGKPKLLDFGIAKMLQPKPFEPVTEFTLTTKILTPNYASPEQLKGESITTASDVYSLGVILYEMLTGKRPYDLQNMALPEILKTISEEIPEKPYKSAISKSSELRKDSSPPPDDRSMPVPDPRMLKGDIDTIILKSLEKDVSERYQTVEQLAGDIGRFLNNLPILAKPPSNIYKFRKFVRRNRLPFVSVCAATVLGLILIVSSVWFARVSDRQARTYLRQAYSSDMNLAMQSYETANIIRVRQLLDRYSDFRYRGWEYDYLQNLAEPKAKISTLKHDSEVWNVVFSPNGDRMATACADGFARIYEVPSGKLIVSTKIRERNIWKLVFSPDGAFLATASGDSSSTSVRIWNTQNGEEVISLVGHTARVRGITYSPNGKTIATGSQDGTIRLWDPISGKQKQVIKLPFFMNRPVETHDLAFSPDGKWLLSGNGSSALIFDLSAKKIIPVTEEIGACLAVAFSPDGKKIAVGTQESTINVYDSETLLKKFKIEVHNAPIRDVEFSPDGRVLASASSDRTVGFFDSETGLELTDIRTHTSDVWSVAFSPKGSYFASGSTDFDAHLFNPEELYRVFSFGSAAGFSQQWSAITMDGKK